MSRSLYAMLQGLGGRQISEPARLEALAAQQQRLRAANLLPTGLLLEACDLSSKRVAVVGGGLAGLCAGWFLTACGVPVVVFEASNRVGGRVHTDDTFIPGRVVEAGAELIGDNHPMWIALAEIFQLE